jgi:membrane protease YdiL (CAAX protease family)
MRSVKPEVRSNWAPFAAAGTSLFVVYLAVQLFWLGAAFRPVSYLPFLEGLFKVVVWVGPCLLVTMLWTRASLHDAWRALGLHGPVARGWTIGLLATLPMALAAVVSGPQLPDLDDLVGNVLLGPFAEEVLFRGFLFGVLWRRARWPWSLALVVSSIVFGLAHLRSLSLLIGVRAALFGHYEGAFRQLASQVPSMVTVGGAFALGGLLFCWIYYRSGTLWPAIGVHACMNFWWDVSRVGDRPLVREVDLVSLAQGLSVLLALVLTIKARSSRTLLSPKLEARS